MKYYLSIQQNIFDQATQNVALETYFNEEYPYFLDDYHHVISDHSEQLEDITEQLTKCDLSKCMMATRYCDNNRQQASDDNIHDQEMNLELNFYIELLDNIHFWFNHQFDVGMRIKKEILDLKNNEDEDDEIENKDQFFDHTFYRMKMEIKKKRQTSKFKRFDNSNNNKYNIHFEDPIATNNANHEILRMDTIYQSLNKDKIEQRLIDEFTEFINVEDYDSDAFIEDIIDYKKGSNIINQMNNIFFTKFIEKYCDDLNHLALGSMYYVYES